jgi:hypothetical protein
MVTITLRHPKPREGLCTHCIGLWVDFGAGLDDTENLATTGICSLDGPAPYTDYAIPVALYNISADKTRTEVQIKLWLTFRESVWLGILTLVGLDARNFVVV